MKKKIIILSIAAVMVMGTVLGGTLAEYQANTDTRKSISTPSVEVGIKLGDKITGDAETVEYGSSDVKDGLIEQEVQGINNGSKEIYIRLTINKAWYNQNEKVFLNAGKDLNSHYIGVRRANEGDWIVQDEDDQESGNGETIFFYYKYPVQPGETTSAVMDAITLFKDAAENTNHYSGLQAKMGFDADAIQCTAANEAMEAEWGVVPVIDGNGVITTVENQ